MRWERALSTSQGFGAILGEEEVVGGLIQLIDAEMKGDEKTAGELRGKLTQALSERAEVARAVKVAINTGAEEKQGEKPQEKKEKGTALEELFGL